MNRANAKAVTGLLLLIVFTGVFVTMFLPIFRGRNALEYLDDLYNSISKGSAYYIPSVREQSRAFVGGSVGVTLKMDDEKQAEQTALLYRKGGAEATATGSEVTVAGDLGKILENCLDDAEAMYDNNAETVRRKYGYDERRVLCNWWQSLKAMDKGLCQQKLFKEAKVVTLVKRKAVETSYNYYGVKPEKITDRIGVVLFSLVFYVVYTLWYGYAVMFLFEGLGLKLSR